MRYQHQTPRTPHSRKIRPVAGAAIPILLASVSAWPASSPSARAAGGRKESRADTAVSTSIAPGGGFFGYANGGWLEGASVPAGRDRWTGRDGIQGVVRRR